jgi:hypothetical protein
MPNAINKSSNKKALAKPRRCFVKMKIILCSKKLLTRAINEYTLIITGALKVSKSG